jgi:hypothetical protein
MSITSSLPPSSWVNWTKILARRVVRLRPARYLQINPQTLKMAPRCL